MQGGKFMGHPIRVLQAADFRLHEPLVSVGHLPAAQQEIYQQARERAAIAVFDAAISRNADLLLLTGTLTHFEQEPRLACFLLEQFRRLASAGVQVLWVASDSSPLPTWALDPRAIRLLHPGKWSSVQTLNGRQTILIQHDSAENGASNQSNGKSQPEHDLHISISAGAPSVHYRTMAAPKGTQHNTIPLHHTGPESTGKSGFLVVDVSQKGHLQVEHVSCPIVEWTCETIDVTPHQNRNSLIKEIRQRLGEARSRTQAKLLCVNWKVTGSGPVWEELLSPKVTPLLQEIRYLTHTNTHVWSSKLDYDLADEQLQEWKESWPFAEALHQLDHLEEGDLQAAAATPHLASNFKRSDRSGLMLQRVLTRCRLRIARELRPSVTAHHRFEQ